MLVPVPVHTGLFVALEADDLNTNSWIHLGVGRVQGAFDIGDAILTVERFPFDAVEMLPYAYSIIVAPQPSLTPPIRYALNELHPVNNLIRDRYQELPWRGNVLVVRHDRHGVADMQVEDFALVDLIITRYTNCLHDPKESADSRL